MKNLYILDAVSFLFRSYFAIGGMTNPRGQSTNALYGFIRSIQKIQKDFSPDTIVAVFDGPNNKKARTAIYEEYKSNREGMPEDLFPQLEWAHNFCEAAGIPYLSEEGVEADDLIGAITKWAENRGTEVFICSSDKDLCQLISDKVFMVNTHKNNLLIDRAKVEEMHGVKPEQIVDYLAIMGDKADNIPGIPGFGPKTAASLLKEYGSLERILCSLDEMQNQKRAEKIKAHVEDARISKKLATLILDVPYPEEETFYHVKPPNLEALNNLYREMNFNTLLKELGQEQIIVPDEKKGFKETLSYKIIDSEDELKTLIEKLNKEPSICIDTETDQLSPMAARLVGVGFCVNSNEAWYIPTNGMLGLDKVIDAVKPLIESPHNAFYGHNIKYDIHILKNHGIHLHNIGFDTMVASHLLAPQNNRHGLDLITLEKFGKVKTPIKDLIGSGKKAISMLDVPIDEVGPYCCEDVDYTCRLKELFEKEIEKEGLSEVLYKIELPLIPVLVDMERYGMYLQKDKLETMSGVLREKLALLEKEIYALAGESFNIKSPKQLGEILFEKLQISIRGKKKSTRADILESLKDDYPIAGKILEYRALEKLRSTYTEALPLQVQEDTGRIHCTFMQTVTATGRLSCKDPNLQNIPIRSEEGKKIREAFVPELPGWVYLSADYSQIELRLLAHLSEDPKLINAFNKGEDIHASTAATVFDVPLEEVTKQMRAGAKAVNFGIIYGQQAYGLSQELGIDMKEASAFIKKYFERYPGVRDFIESSKEKVRKMGVATTMFNRKRPIPEINSTNGMIRSAAERLAVNTPLQGSQADIIKQAMIEVQKALKEERLAHMVLQIHDELIFELPEENIVRTQEIVQTIMENITSLSVPLIANIAIGKNWGEC
ncbi:MAG: DNA polymerase I [Simkaniaceae bacterium]|nr:MAG: DNA polymerase I [Simkaniaceae bacterium]